MIGGFPRAGTRNFCDVVNASPVCKLEGEFENSAYTQLADLVDAIDRKYAGRWMEKGFQERRLTSILKTYSLFSKTRKCEEPDWDKLQVAGFKKPFIETLHGATRTLFEPEVSQLVQFYCVRNVFDTFNSLAGAFGYSVEQYNEGIRQSVDSLIALQKDAFFKFRPLSLDDYVASEDKPRWIKEHLFDVIGVATDIEECSAYLHTVTNRNRTPRGRRRAGITDREREQITRDKKFVESIDWLEQYFGVRLLDV